MEEIILDQDFNKRLNIVEATKGKRFANYFIDSIITTIVIYSISYFIEIALFSTDVIVMGYPDWYLTYSILQIILNYLLIVMYFIFTANFLNGKSIAKFVTKTKVLSSDGSKPSIDTIIKRSFCRIVPFNAFSFLGENNGWHDRWSKTIVIDEDESTI